MNDEIPSLNKEEVEKINEQLKKVRFELIGNEFMMTDKGKWYLPIKGI